MRESIRTINYSSITNTRLACTLEEAAGCTT
jgi:hypothetical protein